MGILSVNSERAGRNVSNTIDSLTSPTLQALPERQGRHPVTLQTKSPHIRQIAFSSSFRYRNDVVGIPEVPPKAPILLELLPRRVVELALVLAQCFGVEAALAAH